MLSVLKIPMAGSAAELPRLAGRIATSFSFFRKYRKLIHHLSHPSTKDDPINCHQLHTQHTAPLSTGASTFADRGSPATAPNKLVARGGREQRCLLSIAPQNASLVTTTCCLG